MKARKVPAPITPDREYNSHYTQGLRKPCQIPPVVIASGSALTNPRASALERRAVRIFDQLESSVVVSRDRRRRELRTGAFSLPFGVVALLPLCKTVVWARPRTCVPVGLVVPGSVLGLGGVSGRSHGRDGQHSPSHLRGGREWEHHCGEGHPGEWQWRAEGQHSDSNPISLAFSGSARPALPHFCRQSVVRPKAEFLAKKVEVSQDLGHLFRDISCCVPSAEHCAGATGGCQVDLDLLRAQRPVYTVLLSSPGTLFETPASLPTYEMGLSSGFRIQTLLLLCSHDFSQDELGVLRNSLCTVCCWVLFHWQAPIPSAPTHPHL